MKNQKKAARSPGRVLRLGGKLGSLRVVTQKIGKGGLLVVSRFVTEGATKSTPHPLEGKVLIPDDASGVAYRDYALNAASSFLTAAIDAQQIAYTRHDYPEMYLKAFPLLHWCKPPTPRSGQGSGGDDAQETMAARLDRLRFVLWQEHVSELEALEDVMDAAKALAGDAKRRRSRPAAAEFLRQRGKKLRCLPFARIARYSLAAAVRSLSEKGGKWSGSKVVLERLERDCRQEFLRQGLLIADQHLGRAAALMRRHGSTEDIEELLKRGFNIIFVDRHDNGLRDEDLDTSLNEILRILETTSLAVKRNCRSAAKSNLQMARRWLEELVRG